MKLEAFDDIGGCLLEYMTVRGKEGGAVKLCQGMRDVTWNGLYLLGISSPCQESKQTGIQEG